MSGCLVTSSTFIRTACNSRGQHYFSHGQKLRISLTGLSRQTQPEQPWKFIFLQLSPFNHAYSPGIEYFPRSFPLDMVSLDQKTAAGLIGCHGDMSSNLRACSIAHSSLGRGWSWAFLLGNIFSKVYCRSGNTRFCNRQNRQRCWRVRSRKKCLMRARYVSR